MGEYPESVEEFEKNSLGAVRGAKKTALDPASKWADEWSFVDPARTKQRGLSGVRRPLRSRRSCQVFPSSDRRSSSPADEWKTAPRRRAGSVRRVVQLLAVAKFRR